MATLGVKNGKWVDIFTISQEENELGKYAIEVSERELNGKTVTTYQIVEHWADPNLFATNIDYEGTAEEIKRGEDEFNQKLKNMGFPPYIGEGK